MNRNDRNVRNTPFQFLPSRIEQASIETYAVNTRSIPPGGKSMLDTLGATVAFVVPPVAAYRNQITAMAAGST